MEDEIDELKEEIKNLNERIDALEKVNRHRKAFKYAKAILKVCLLLLSVYAIWRGYEYVVNEVPKVVDEKIKEIKIPNS